MQYLTLARASFNPLSAFQRAQHRLHLKALENAPLLVVGGAIITAITRLWFDNPSLAAGTMLLLAAALWQAGLPAAQRLSPRHLVVLAVVLFVVSALMGAPEAYAQSSGSTLGSMATSLKNDMGSMYQLVVYGCYGGGRVSTATGINNGIKKSKGDQQVTTGHVLGYGLGVPALGMVGYVMDNAAGSMGGSSSQMNTLPVSTN